MVPEKVAEIVGKLPYMHIREARVFFDLITHNHLRSVLELGFFHGVSSTYIAGALAEELSPGHLTTIDLRTARDRTPNITELLERAGLSHLATVFFEEKSFNWRLLELLRLSPPPYFDFCYFDGAHTWYDTGFAFCLVERMLTPGAWIVFDDLYFAFRNSNNRDKAWVRRMPEEEQVTQQLLYVFELLVQTNPQFANFRRLNGRFAFAQKKNPALGPDAYLPTALDVAVSRALERAQRDPEFRNQLLFDPEGVLTEFLPEGTILPVAVTFVESDSRAPLPAMSQADGSFVIPLERPIWDFAHSRAELSFLLEDGPEV